MLLLWLAGTFLLEGIELRLSKEFAMYHPSVQPRHVRQGRIACEVGELAVVIRVMGGRNGKLDEGAPCERHVEPVAATSGPLIWVFRGPLGGFFTIIGW
jgi:hypothetical protein